MWLTTKAGMKSGSLRMMPAPPMRTTACGTLSCVTIRRPPSRIGASGTATRVPVAGSEPNTRSSVWPSVAASISPTAAIFRVSRVSTWRT